jgi:hypothetical protein
MTVEYVCKFCHRPFSFECELPQDVPFDLAKWKAMLCCNPCHDYERSRRDIEAAVAKEVARLLIARHGTPNPEKLKISEQDICRNLTALTKRYATAVCKHAGAVNYWEPVFVEHIMERPDLVGDTLYRYRRTIHQPSPP